MAVSLQTILSRVTTLLQDPTFVRWPLTELYGYVADGEKEVCLFKPNAYITLGNTQLAAGSKQTLPSGGLALLDVIRNRGAAGTTEGAAIRVVSREILDAQIPNWHTTAGDGTVKHYVYNPLDPVHFYVYPPQPATPHYVELLYGGVPTGLSSYTSDGSTLAHYSSVNINLPDIYLNPLVNYTLFRAYSKDAEYAQNGVLAQKYYELFMGAVTGKTAVEQAVNPNQNIGGFNPNMATGAPK